MKFKSKLMVAAMVAMMGVAAMAQDRAYTRLGVTSLGGPPILIEYRFTESNGELGYIFISGFGNKDACSTGFKKIIKSEESGAILYTEVDARLTGCSNIRFVFPNGDLSAGYVQVKLQDGGYKPVLDYLASLERKGIKPSLNLKK